MYHNIQTLKFKFNSISLRERVIVSLCVLISIYFLLDFFIIQNSIVSQHSYELRLDIAKEKIDKISIEENELKNKIFNNSKVKDKKGIENIVAMIKERDKEIVGVSDFLIKKDEIGITLTEFYNLSKDVIIKDFKHSDIVIVSGGGDDNDKSLERFYRYNFEVNMYGKYSDIVSYIASIEASGLSIYLDSVSYKVDRYPYANVNLSAFFIIDKVVEIKEVINVN